MSKAFGEIAGYILAALVLAYALGGLTKASSPAGGSAKDQASTDPAPPKTPRPLQLDDTPTPSAPATVPIPAPATAPVPQAAPTIPTPRPVDVVFDEVTYVATEDAYVKTFTVNRPVLAMLFVSIDNTVPVDLVVSRGVVDKTQYVLAAGMQQGASVLASIFGDDQDRKDMAKASPFRNRLSKQGVYHQYETPWVRLDPGVYSVLIDNSGAYTPTRGDAPVRLVLSVRDVE